MSNRTDTAGKKAAAVIEAFLATHPRPSPEQWRELTLMHPQYATQIAETSLLLAEGDSEEVVPFDLELFNATRSAMLTEVAKNANTVSEAKAALKQCRGPAARKFASQIGLGDRDELLNQIVSGEVSAPYVLVKRLAAKLHVQFVALAEVFLLNSQAHPAQSFKADGKPQVNLQPASWEEAIRAAGITGDEAARLLQLENEIE